MKKKLGRSPWLADLRIMCGSKYGAVSKFNAFLQPGWFSMVIVSGGVLEFSIGGVQEKVGAMELYAIPGGGVLSGSEGQPRFCLVSCTFALAVSSRIAKYPSAYLEALTAKPGSALPLSRKELRQLLRIVAMLREKIYRRINQELESEIVHLCLNLLFCEYGAICLRNASGEPLLHDRAGKITAAFAGLLQEHSQAGLDIGFYAGLLCISPSYLRRCVRRVTGMHAGYFIDSARLSEAYRLLLDENLSVAEAADQLGFATPFSFSAFFKKRAGITPSRYRAILRK